ncbi:MAG TPA: hypothetical protein VFP65_25680 [Anaeromyxobacteraceae bacterium]|nr:hypothetical protein [Anaeromyxobacteraceae bacterium]
MTAPRQVLPGTYLVTRRCAQRQFLLTPSAITNQVFLYLLAVAAGRYGVEVHAFCILSNHYHLVVTDAHARLPAFQQFLDGLVARAVNASLGRWEAFWAPDSYSAVRLATAADVIEKIAYVLVNPVAAGLVASGDLWPGLRSAPALIGGDALEVERPEHFFDPAGPLPDRVRLRVTTPSGFGSADRLRAELAPAIARREDEARAEWHARGGFVGARRVLAQEPTARARSTEPKRALNPRVAVHDKWKRIEVLGRLVEFLRAYRRAWLARRAGERDALFPAGTYQLRVMHGVPCAASS